MQQLISNAPVVENMTFEDGHVVRNTHRIQVESLVNFMLKNDYIPEFREFNSDRQVHAFVYNGYKAHRYPLQRIKFNTAVKLHNHVSSQDKLIEKVKMQHCRKMGNIVMSHKVKLVSE